MTAPEPFTGDALWSAGEVREQSQQVPGHLDVWDVLAQSCDACNADPGEPCNVGCIGEAAQSELDTTSSASRQHYIDTGEYLPQAEQ